MSQSSGSNVVPFSARERQRLTPRESASVLRGCRELALDRMAQALSGMLDRVEDELLQLAAAAPDREERDAYLDAGTEARDKRSLIESTFRQHFLACFNRKVRGEEGEVGAAQSGESAEALAVSAMSRKLEAACEAELGVLGRRMGFLLEAQFASMAALSLDKKRREHRAPPAILPHETVPPATAGKSRRPVA